MEYDNFYILSRALLIEVKLGAAVSLEFAWFGRIFPRGQLTVINAARFESPRIKGITLDDFLLEQA